MLGKSLLVFTLLSVSVSSNAAVNCSGIIERLFISNTGGLVIWPTWSAQHNQVCSVAGEWKGISPETCKAWLSVAQIAKVAKTPVRAQYGGDAACASIAGYGSAPAPSYLMLDK